MKGLQRERKRRRVLSVFTPVDSRLITSSGFSSVSAGMATPEVIELRTKKIEEVMDGNETTQVFTVLPDRRTGTVGAAMMVSTHTSMICLWLGQCKRWPGCPAWAEILRVWRWLWLHRHNGHDAEVQGECA